MTAGEDFRILLTVNQAIKINNKTRKIRINDCTPLDDPLKNRSHSDSVNNTLAY